MVWMQKLARAGAQYIRDCWSECAKFAKHLQPQIPCDIGELQISLDLFSRVIGNSLLIQIGLVIPMWRTEYDVENTYELYVIPIFEILKHSKLSEGFVWV